jgi:hypothetical protein
MQDFFDLARSGPLWIGLFVGLSDWYARVILKDWDSAPFLMVIAASFGAAAMLLAVAAYDSAVIIEAVGWYTVGLLAATGVFLLLRRLDRSRR